MYRFGNGQTKNAKASIWSGICRHNRGAVLVGIAGALMGWCIEYTSIQLACGASMAMFEALSRGPFKNFVILLLKVVFG